MNAYFCRSDKAHICSARSFALVWIARDKKLYGRNAGGVAMRKTMLPATLLENDFVENDFAVKDQERNLNSIR